MVGECDVSADAVQVVAAAREEPGLTHARAARLALRLRLLLRVLLARALLDPLEELRQVRRRRAAIG